MIWISLLWNPKKIIFKKVANIIARLVDLKSHKVLGMPNPFLLAEIWGFTAKAALTWLIFAADLVVLSLPEQPAFWFWTVPLSWNFQIGFLIDFFVGGGLFWNLSRNRTILLTSKKNFPPKKFFARLLTGFCYSFTIKLCKKISGLYKEF